MSGRGGGQSKAFIIIGGFVILALLWSALFGGNGVVDMIRLNRHKEALEAEIAEVREQNRLLWAEIKALRAKDSKAVEQLAREKLVMVGDDEVIYQFRNDTD